MARLRGTGKDPLGRYGENQIFDVPAEDALYQDLIDRGWAEEVAPEDDPGRTTSQMAQAVVDNTPLQDPVEQELAEKVADRAYDIVHTGDPKAKKGAANLNADPDANKGHRGQLTPDQVTASSRASHDPEGAAKARAKADKDAESSK